MYLPSFAMPVIFDQPWADGSVLLGLLAACGLVGALSVAVLAFRQRRPLDPRARRLALPRRVNERSAV